MEVTTELEWKSKVITQKEQKAAALSCIKLKSDPREHYLGSLKTDILHERTQNMYKIK